MLGIGARAHRNQGAEVDLGTIDFAGRKIVAGRTGDAREHDVVDRTAELLLHLADHAQVEARPVEAPVRPDRHVERRLRSGRERPGEGLGEA